MQLRFRRRSTRQTRLPFVGQPLNKYHPVCPTLGHPPHLCTRPPSEANAPRVPRADKQAHSRISSATPLCVLSHAFKNLAPSCCVKGRLWQALVRAHCHYNPPHQRAATSTSGPHDRQARGYGSLQRALRRGAMTTNGWRNAGGFTPIRWRGGPFEFLSPHLSGQVPVFGKNHGAQYCTSSPLGRSEGGDPLRVNPGGRFLQRRNKSPGASASRVSTRNISWSAHNLA